MSLNLSLDITTATLADLEAFLAAALLRALLTTPTWSLTAPTCG